MVVDGTLKSRNHYQTLSERSQTDWIVVSLNLTELECCQEAGQNCETCGLILVLKKT